MPLFEPVDTQEKHVSVSSSGAAFTTIKDAIDSIVTAGDASASNPYVIDVGPGTYVEDNSGGAITIPNYVSIIGDTFIASIVTPSTTSIDMFVTDTLGQATIKNITISGVTTAAAITGSPSFFFGIENCRLLDNKYGLKAAGASVFNVRNTLFTGNDIGIEATATASVVAISCSMLTADAGATDIGISVDGAGTEVTALAFTTGKIATGKFDHIIQATNSAKLNLHGSQLRDGDHGVHIDSGAILDMQALEISDCGIAIHIASTGVSAVQGTSLLIEDCTTHILADTTNFTFAVNGGFAYRNRINIPAAASSFNFSFIDNDPTMTSDGAQINTKEFAIGTPDQGAESVFGEGDSYVKDMQVHQYDVSAGSGSRFTDVSAAARSSSGSAVTYPVGAAIGDALVIAAPRKFWGVKLAMTTATVRDTLTVVVFEVWNGATWTPFNVMETMADAPYTPQADDPLEAPGNFHIRFDEVIDGIFSADDNTLDEIPNYGSNHYVIRVRVAGAAPLTAPVVEQIKLHSSRTEINSDGVVEQFGKARGRLVEIRDPAITFLKPGNKPANDTIPVSAGITLQFKENLFENAALDELQATILVPEQADTSMPLRFDLLWYSNITTGNVEWDLITAITRDDSVMDGSNAEIASAAVTTVSTTSDQLNTTTFLIDISTALPGSSEIAIHFGRDATGGNAADTLNGDVTLKTGRFTYRTWRQ